MRNALHAIALIWLTWALAAALLPLHAGAATSAAWLTTAYEGSAAGSVQGTRRPAVPSYSLSYPPEWALQRWPDTLATFGQLSLWSPSGSVVDLVIVPLRPGGPTLHDVIDHDAAFLHGTTREPVALPLGRGTRLTGVPASAGMVETVLYVRHMGFVYRINADTTAGGLPDRTLDVLAAGIHVPANAAVSPARPPSHLPPTGSCCHCPAWGYGWGRVLTSLDGVQVYSNAGDVDNGCTSTYGISYQCVELVQRYFSIRWGYPAIWQGVAAAADMRTHHPAGVIFVPNGGSPAPRRGDSVLFYGGGFGHVALVSAVDRKAGIVRLVEENWSPTGTASLTVYPDGTAGIRDSAFGSYIVAGWLHSVKNRAP